MAGALTSLARRHDAEAQNTGKVRRIGVLASTPTPHLAEAFQQGLRDLGWVDGRNITLEYRYWQARPESLVDAAAQLVRLNVDVIATWDGFGTDAARKATASIPIVFLIHGDPVGVGHVASLARPGGNVTGTGGFFPALSEKRLELLREAVPALSRVAVLWNTANPVKVLEWKTAQAAGRSLSLNLESREVRGPDDFPRAFAAIRSQRPDALMPLEDPVVFRERAAIVEFANKERLPAMYALREFTDLGGLMTYGVDLVASFRRGASYVDRILKGARPADLPVEQPTKFEFIVNLKTARTLGLMIPRSLLLRADQVIQ